MIYIASMNMRGKWAICPDDCLRLNVTSAQHRANENRIAFSPMTIREYKGYLNFEAYWQSGKVYENIPTEKVKSWWKSITKPKRRYPNSRKNKILYSEFDGKQFGYIESRKKVYVPEYFEIIKNSERIKYWQDVVSKGYNIVVYDYDGPRDVDNQPICLKVDKELLLDKINDIKHPFGHGYIIAGYLANILPSDYT